MGERHLITEIPTVDVYVIEPGGACNQYRWDTHLGVFVLDTILRPASPRGADLARLPLDPRAVQAAQETMKRRLPAWAQDAGHPASSHVLASLGPSLQVLVLADPPNPPGTRLSVRIIGAINLAAQPDVTLPASSEMPADAATNPPALSHMIALAVPDADRTLAQVRSVSDLPEPVASRLNHALAHIDGLAANSPAERYSTLTAEEVLELLRATRADVRVAQRAAERAERLLPAERLSRPRTSEPSAREARISLGSSSESPATGEGWRGLSGLSVAELRTRGEVVYGEAEHLLRWVPTRFVRYLDELLLPDEPLLFFAECPAFTVRGWTGEAAGLTADASRQASNSRSTVASALGRLRVRHIQAGLLVMTDRQLLLLRDYASPDATMVQWGYRAQSWPLSLLAGVRLLLPETALDRTVLGAWPHDVQARVVGPARFDETTLPRLPRLVLALEGQHGVEITGAAFPARQGDALAASARLLEDFLPFPATSGSADKRVRIVSEVEPWRPTETEAAELVSLGGMIPEPIAQRLEQALREALHDGEQILVQARTPSASGDQNDSALLALTDGRLMLVRSSAESGNAAPVEVYPLASITAAVLQHSLLACELRWDVPDVRHPSTTRVHRLRFPSTLIVPFRALYTRLRLSLAGKAAMPAGVAGPVVGSGASH